MFRNSAAPPRIEYFSLFGRKERRQSQSPSSWLSPFILNSGVGHSAAGAGSSIPDSCVGSSSSTTWTIMTFCLAGYTAAGSWNLEQNWDLNPDIPILIVCILSDILAAVPVCILSKKYFMTVNYLLPSSIFYTERHKNNSYFQDKEITVCKSIF